MAVTTAKTPSDGRHANPSPQSRDTRELLPVLGLREYWYPVLLDKEVGSKKPVMVTMLGDDICFFYHGMTFDETGLCIAALGEGPLSPMPGKLRAKVYPTATIKGVVWMWMGAGEPAPLEDCIPEEFLDDSVQLFNW